MDKEVDSCCCPKIGITLHILPIDEQMHVNRPQHRPSHGHQYTCHSLFYHNATSFLQATSVLSTVRCWVCQSPAKKTRSATFHLQQCYIHPGPWWSQPPTSPTTLPGFPARHFHPQALSVLYSHRNEREVFPCGQSQEPRSRYCMCMLTHVPMPLQQPLMPLSRCMEAPDPERGSRP